MSVIEETTLVYVASNQNSNKFYSLALHDDGTVDKRWGRVGATGQHQRVSGGRRVYDATIDQKRRKGYATVPAGTGAAPIASPALATIATKAMQVADADSDARDLVARIARANRHHIETTSGGRISTTTSGARTALGAITPAAVDQARALLHAISRHRAANEAWTPLLDRYLTLVPQVVPARAGWAEHFFDAPGSFREQYRLLDALQTATTIDADDADDAFRYRIAKVTDRAEHERVASLFHGTRIHRHPAGDLRVKAVYALTDSADGSAKTAATAKTLGNVRPLWHGTAAGNVLSILSKGLVISDVADNGRMFGNGVYLTDQSSKATGYSGTGVWGGRDREHFLLLADVALGRTLRPAARHEALRPDVHRRYNAIDVRGGTCGVRNNETIVWDLNQINVRYLLELH